MESLASPTTPSRKAVSASRPRFAIAASNFLTARGSPSISPPPTSRKKVPRSIFPRRSALPGAWANSSASPSTKSRCSANFLSTAASARSAARSPPRSPRANPASTLSPSPKPTRAKPPSSTASKSLPVKSLPQTVDLGSPNFSATFSKSCARRLKTAPPPFHALRRPSRLPSRFMLAAAMNPCPCGYFGDPTRECHCTPPMIQRFVSEISGPLLDRIDIHIEVPAVKYKELRAPSSAEDSAAVRQRVIAARDRQLERFSGEKKTYANAQMMPKMIRKHCAISAEGDKLLENAITRLGLSARAHDRILKVARTIADLDGAASIEPRYLSEAIQYRTLDRSYWA